MIKKLLAFVPPAVASIGSLDQLTRGRDDGIYLYQISSGASGISSGKIVIIH